MSITEDFKSQLYELIEQNKDESNNKVFELLKPYKDQLYEILYRDGESLLHWACAFDNVPICKYLVENGLHVNLNNYRGTSPFYYACMNNANNSVLFMISVNVNPFQRSGFSGEFPIDRLVDDDVIMKLTKYSAEKFPILEFEDDKLKVVSNNRILTYKYRLYMNILSNVFYLYNPHKYTLQGWEVDDNTQQLYDKGGIKALMAKCEQLYSDYFDELEKSKLPEYNNKRCLGCNTEDCKSRCGKCKLAYYCSKDCQKKTHKFHTFDCNVPK